MLAISAFFNNWKLHGDVPTIHRIHISFFSLPIGICALLPKRQSQWLEPLQVGLRQVCVWVAVCVWRFTGPLIESLLHPTIVTSLCLWSNPCVRKLHVTPGDKYNNKDREIISHWLQSMCSASDTFPWISAVTAGGTGPGFCRCNHTNESAVCWQLECASICEWNALQYSW